MSTLAPNNSNKATAPDRQLTLPEKNHQDYLSAVAEHDTLRVEYLNGDIVMTPARSPHHQIIVTNLLFAPQSNSVSVTRRKAACCCFQAPCRIPAFFRGNLSDK